MNTVASSSQLNQSVAIGVAEYLLGYTEFTIGTEEQDETAKTHGVQAMRNGLGDVVSACSGREVEPARTIEQEQRISALIVHVCTTGVLQKALAKIKNTGIRVWNRVFGRAERTLGE
jgi:hypothetical protein